MIFPESTARNRRLLWGGGPLGRTTLGPADKATGRPAQGRPGVRSGRLDASLRHLFSLVTSLALEASFSEPGRPDSASGEAGAPGGARKSWDAQLIPGAGQTSRGSRARKAQSSWPLACPGPMALSFRPKGEPPSEGRPRTGGSHVGIWGFGTATGRGRPDTSPWPSRGRGGCGYLAWDGSKLSPSKATTRLAGNGERAQQSRRPRAWAQEQRGGEPNAGTFFMPSP